MQCWLDCNLDGFVRFVRCGCHAGPGGGARSVPLGVQLPAIAVARDVGGRKLLMWQDSCSGAEVSACGAEGLFIDGFLGSFFAALCVPWEMCRALMAVVNKLDWTARASA